MLSDSSHEIRQQADAALSEFLQEIKNSPVRLLLVAGVVLWTYALINFMQLSRHLPLSWKTGTRCLFIYFFLVLI